MPTTNLKAVDPDAVKHLRLFYDVVNGLVTRWRAREWATGLGQ